MSELLNHPTAERLQAFVEHELDGSERSAVDVHLRGCPQCAEEVEELRSLFEVLSDLPVLAPSAGFADRVMGGVRVRRPAFEWANGWIERLVPQTTRGWATATAFFALPVVGATVLVWWLMAQPGVSAQGLWTVATQLGGSALATVGQWAWTQLAGSVLAVWVSRVMELAGSVGRGEIGLAAVMFATATAASVYVLYQNLFRTNARRTEHATFVI